MATSVGGMQEKEPQFFNKLGRTTVHEGELQRHSVYTRFLHWAYGIFFFLALLTGFAIYLPFLYYQARFRFDPGPLLALSIGLTTMGMMFIAIGLLASALTRNQIIAAVWTFAALFVLVVIVPVAYLFAARQHAGWADGIRFVAILFQIQSFGLGQLDLRYVALHVSVCIFVLSLTVKAIQTRTNR